MRFFATLLFIAGFFTLLKSENSARSTQLLEENWRFINADNPVEFQKQNFDDSGWQKVRVPHDWAIRGNFDMNLDFQYVKVLEDGDSIVKLRTGRTGALPMFGVGWYRHSLAVSPNESGKRFFIEFDGAMSLSKVYVNGKFVGDHPYGYTSFSFDITRFINFKGKNTLAIRLENKPESSRWYSGAGLYRNVRFIKTAQTHIPYNGIFITTPRISSAEAVVMIKTKLSIGAANKQDVRLVTDIFDAAGNKAGSSESAVPATDSTEISQTISIKNPQLWDVNSPRQYLAVTRVIADKKPVDEVQTYFGCRTISFDKNAGFALNGQTVKLKGVCLHHDLGPLGAAVNYRATERQLTMMKEMGCNAVRTSHNPPSPELLEICDRIGLMVMVEAFDEWECGKNLNGYCNYFEQWAQKDIQSMIRRDRNHPCVIMWSIGNEVREQSSEKGKQIAAFLVKACKEEDTTRPTTAGFNQHNAAIKNGLANEVDIVGFNYKPSDYLAKHQKYPDFILLGTETASTVSSRGEYKFPAVEKRDPWYNDYQVSSYDLEYPNWGTTPDAEFYAQDQYPFVLGEFVWTGFDYLGEPTPYNQGTPARSSYFGIVDLAGLKKDRYYLYQSKWSSAPVLHLLPHWNWPDRTGQKVPVFCYTNYPKAELFVNGVSMGMRENDKTDKLKRYRLMWNDVEYQPGEIKVIAYNQDGKPAEERKIKTAGEPHSIRMIADRKNLKADKNDLSFITLEIVDKDGNLCPRANNMVFLDVSGAGKLKAVCNGNPIDQTSFGSNYMRAFNGKLVIVVEPTKQKGEITVKASGGKLSVNQLRLETGN